VTGSSIAVCPWAAIVKIDAVSYIIPTVRSAPTIVIAILIEPATIAVHKHVSDSDQHERAHLSIALSGHCYNCNWVHACTVVVCQNLPQKQSKHQDNTAEH
jgi:hypothetical protein